MIRAQLFYCYISDLLYFPHFLSWARSFCVSVQLSETYGQTHYKRARNPHRVRLPRDLPNVSDTEFSACISDYR